MKIPEELIDLVKTVSPIIATGLGSPIAGIILNIVLNAFGIDHKNGEENISESISNDPEYILKLAELEHRHKEELLKILSDDILTILHLKKSI